MKNIIKAGATGDAFGYQIEFDDMKKIFDKYGSNGLQYKACDELEVSDDTQMTLFLLEAVNEYRENKVFDMKYFIEKVHQSYKEWFFTQHHRGDIIKGNRLVSQKIMYKSQAPGGTCLSALGNPVGRSLKRKINDSKGCGNVMRVAPLLLLQTHFELTNAQLFEVAVHQGAITHGNDEGLSATGFFTVLLSMLAHHNSFDASYGEALGICQKWASNRFIDYIESVYATIKKPEILTFDNLVNSLGEGWTSDSAVGVAMYCSQKSVSFKECLELSANHRGDSDSTASMAAQLFAAEHGTKDFLFSTDVDSVIDRMLS